MTEKDGLELGMQHSVNAQSFELLWVLLRELTKNKPDFSKKFRIVLEHDPEKPMVEVKYYADFQIIELHT